MRALSFRTGRWLRHHLVQLCQTWEEKKLQWKLFLFSLSLRPFHHLFLPPTFFPFPLPHLPPHTHSHHTSASRLLQGVQCLSKVKDDDASELSCRVMQHWFFCTDMHLGSPGTRSHPCLSDSLSPQTETISSMKIFKDYNALRPPHLSLPLTDKMRSHQDPSNDQCRSGEWTVLN